MPTQRAKSGRRDHGVALRAWCPRSSSTRWRRDALRGGGRQQFEKLAAELGLRPPQAIHSTDGCSTSRLLEVELSWPITAGTTRGCASSVCGSAARLPAKGNSSSSTRRCVCSCARLPELGTRDAGRRHRGRAHTARVAAAQVGVKERPCQQRQVCSDPEDLGVTPPRKPKKPTKKTPNPVASCSLSPRTTRTLQALLNGDNATVAML